MKSETFIKVLREIIREEVQSVVRNELSMLLETPKPQKSVTEIKKTDVKNSLIDSIRPIKNNQPQKSTTFTNNNILNDILNETAYSSDWKSVVEATSNMAPNFGPYGGSAEPKVVNSVDQMLSSARPAGDVTHVQIDAVPDFSALMSTMKEKGQI
jgi:hypothetical protein